MKTAFSVLSTIERYPEFLPFCQEARVLKNQNQHQQVQNRFGWGPVSYSFRTLAVFDPPRQLVITSTDGPFRDFRLEWQVRPLTATNQGGCQIVADYAMTLRHDWLQRLLMVAAPQMERRLATAFQARILNQVRRTRPKE